MRIIVIITNEYRYHSRRMTKPPAINSLLVGTSALVRPPPPPPTCPTRNEYLPDASKEAPVGDVAGPNSRPSRYQFRAAKRTCRIRILPALSTCLCLRSWTNERAGRGAGDADWLFGSRQIRVTNVNCQ